MEGYEAMWEISGTTCLVGFKIPGISIITCYIMYSTFSIGFGKQTLAQKVPDFHNAFPNICLYSFFISFDLVHGSTSTISYGGQPFYTTSPPHNDNNSN